MTIQNIGIIGGAGKMGGMFADQFRKLGKTVLVTDIGTQNKEHELVSKSELIIISVPIEVAVDVVKRIKRWLHKDQILSDFTSVKHYIVPEMVKTEASVISCHPMFASMQNVAGQNIVLLPVREGRHYKKVERLFKELDLNTVRMGDWKKHDESMSFIQGLMHFLHIVFTQTLHSKDVDLETILSICSPVYMANFAFSCRILNRDPHLYTHILMDNPKNVDVLHSFVENASESLKLIQKKEDQKFEDNFRVYQDFLGNFASKFSEQSDYLVQSMRDYAKLKSEN